MQIPSSDSLGSRLARVAALTLWLAFGLSLPGGTARAEAVARVAPAAASAASAASGGTASSPTANAATSPSGLDPALEQQVRALALSAAVPAGVTRVEVALGSLDPRLHLAPCRKVEPYVPSGAKLWGKSRIGLRCTQGPTPWNVYLAVTVKAFGRALVASHGAAAGSVLAAGDVSSAEVDWAEEPSAALLDAPQAVGRTLAVAVAAGQSLRQAQFKAKLWFSAGDTVKVIALGSGFSLEGEGQALSNGVEGQMARVRTESGRVLTGIPAGERRIELSL